jgi:urea transporter
MDSGQVHEADTKTETKTETGRTPNVKAALLSGESPVPVPLPLLVPFRGIGQVFFQENALTGLLFAVGIAISSPLGAAGLVVGSAIGCATAWALKYDRSETLAGIYGFNSALVGIATLFFFQPGAASFAMLFVGCAAAAPLTWLMRKHVPFPTYTSPFIVVTWVLFLVGNGLGVPRVAAGGAIEAQFAVAVAHGVSQVMFQASVWTALFFLVGIAASDRKHAAWVLAGAVLGTLVGSYHATAVARAVDPERLVDRSLTETIALGLYGYNATLAAVALFLARRSLVPPLLGILVSVPITEYFPMTGLPALTAPFVLATWVVLALGRVEAKYLAPPAPAHP